MGKKRKCNCKEEGYFSIACVAIPLPYFFSILWIIISLG